MAKLVTGREADAERVAQAAETHGKKAQEGIRAALAPYLPKRELEHLPDLAGFLATLAKALR
jgi:hypothetical protein